MRVGGYTRSPLPLGPNDPPLYCPWCGEAALVQLDDGTPYGFWRVIEDWRLGPFHCRGCNTTFAVTRPAESADIREEVGDFFRRIDAAAGRLEGGAT